MSPTFCCEKCGTDVPDLIVSQEAWKAIERSLVNKSVTLAVAELKYYTDCTEQESREYINHLLKCAYAWPSSSDDEKILGIIEKAFEGIKKPDHFTDYTHCDECYEHDQTLKNSSKETATRKDFGNAGWDPMTFSTGEGLLYYFPVLARFALLPNVWRDNDWYGDQLLSHLTWDGKSNKLLSVCNSKQQEAVFLYLKHLEVTRSQEITNYMASSELKQALLIWSDVIV
jgi:hypothetical protein